jgi:hypothetical protein
MDFISSVNTLEFDLLYLEDFNDLLSALKSVKVNTLILSRGSFSLLSIISPSILKMKTRRNVTFE